MSRRNPLKGRGPQRALKRRLPGLVRYWETRTKERAQYRRARREQQGGHPKGYRTQSGDRADSSAPTQWSPTDSVEDVTS